MPGGHHHCADNYFHRSEAKAASMKFIAETAIIFDRRTEVSHFGSTKNEKIMIEVTLTSSGDTRNFASHEVVDRVLKLLESIEP